MPVDLLNYNPMYMSDPTPRTSKYVVTAEEWSNLWILSVLQTNNTSEAMKLLLDKLKTELWSNNAAAFIKNLEIAGGAGTTIASQLAWLKNYGDGTNTKADTAVVTSNVANTKADNAVSTANTANTKADGANTKSDTAVATANTASATATTAKTTADAVKADYDILKPQMLQAVSDANAAVDAVADKADVAYVDQVAEDFTLGIIHANSITESMMTAAMKKQPGGVASYDTVSTLADDLINLAGAGRTNETVKGNADAVASAVESINTLAGVGNTTTVKALNDALETHMADIVTVATANKILKLDANAKLPADITGESAKVNGIYFRNNNGSLEWSADNATWNPAGGGGIDFEFGLPLF